MFTSIVSHRSSLGDSGLAIFSQPNKPLTVVDVGNYGSTEGYRCFLDPPEEKAGHKSMRQTENANQPGGPLRLIRAVKHPCVRRGQTLILVLIVLAELVVRQSLLS